MEDKTNTPNELMDLVNEDDEVVGDVLKGEANSDTCLIHREVGIIIYDDDKKVLIQQRSKKKNLNPGMWAVSCAGHVPKGMSPLDAAHMELKEELGFDTELEFIEKRLDRISTETRFVYWYVGKYNKERITVEPEEVEEVKWISETEFGSSFDNEIMGGTSKAGLKRFWKDKWNRF
jgi:isopentenyl-diphosphate delta-isomerase